MASTTRSIDPSFTELPLHRLADAALSRARDFHVSHADFRLERIRSQTLRLRDAALQGSEDGQDVGFGVRVIVDGTWGFASSVTLTVEEAVRVTEQAVSVAKIAALINHEPIELATEPPHPEATWVSSYDVDPFTVATAEKVELLAAWSRDLLAGDRVQHVGASLQQVMENKFYADTAGTTTTQQRARIGPVLEAHGFDKDTGRIDSMRTLAPPTGRGWEYLTGTGWDWPAEIAELPDLLAAKLAAPSVEAATYDLVIHPSNLFLTIHESIGHATELDRALGYEANYAGTSFATFDQLGTLRYGSQVMNVTGDRTMEHGLATIGYDDEGVVGQAWDIIKDGTLVGYQLDRRMARSQGLGRSNGCAFADSPRHIPLQRMANVSLQPTPDGPSIGDLISRVDRGIYIVGDKSWSIDMQRYNFQFTGQRFFRIEHGELGGQLRDVAYQATTTDFWGSMEAVGGPDTWVLGGAFNCGKAQPGQVAPVSHGCPAALFRSVRILNTTAESGR
jgi:TldD protein